MFSNLPIAPGNVTYRTPLAVVVEAVVARAAVEQVVARAAADVAPLYIEDGRGVCRDAGAVDSTTTRERVCELLEGGLDAFRKRAERYGLQVDADAS